jgi:hypothetical protein
MTAIARLLAALTLGACAVGMLGCARGACRDHANGTSFGPCKECQCRNGMTVCAAIACIQIPNVGRWHVDGGAD